MHDNKKTITPKELQSRIDEAAKLRREAAALKLEADMLDAETDAIEEIGRDAYLAGMAGELKAAEGNLAERMRINQQQGQAMVALRSALADVAAGDPTMTVEQAIAIETARATHTVRDALAIVEAGQLNCVPPASQQPQ